MPVRLDLSNKVQIFLNVQPRILIYDSISEKKNIHQNESIERLARFFKRAKSWSLIDAPVALYARAHTHTAPHRVQDTPIQWNESL